MKFNESNPRIIEQATLKELETFYYNNALYLSYSSFQDFLQEIKDSGTKIIE